ncbi:MAG: DoxX family protein [Castellaniella sp.]|jgi:putative oxidoreductase|uniref:DoxX family protein n=1 Tax=Castellaniella sp. TaxID=1955812 RepID=UPI003C70CDA9
MSSSAYDDLGKLILRLSLGILILLHGLGKLDGGVGWLVGMLDQRGLPGFIAYGVYIGEIVAPVLIILGLFTRLGGLILILNMLFVFGLVHMNELFTLGKSGGWALELQGMFLFTSIAVTLFGAGAYSLGGRNGRWN